MVAKADTLNNITAAVDLDIEQVLAEAIHPKSNNLDIDLNCLQGNILKAHGRDEARHIFLKFIAEDPKLIRSWIREYTVNYVTSAAQQIRDAILREKIPQHSGGLFGCIYLTAKGYEWLGFQPDTNSFDPTFIKGMKNRDPYRFYENGQPNEVENKDPPSDEWDPMYQKDIYCECGFDNNHRHMRQALNDLNSLPDNSSE